MKVRAGKSKKKKSRSVGDGLFKRNSGGDSTLELRDNRPDVLAQRKRQEIARSRCPIQLKIHQEKDGSGTQHQEAAYSPAMANEYSPRQPMQRAKKDSVLPDKLSSGVESLSGYSMDDVKVYYNSAKPAQIQARAYTQGTDIHLASGQEKYLPHEAWHVVQQKQGRVQPTLRMQGIDINDDSALEREADIMGERSLKLNPGASKTDKNLGISRPTVQRAFDPALQINSADDLRAQLASAGYDVSGTNLNRLFFREGTDASRTLSSIEAIASAFDLRKRSIDIPPAPELATALPASEPPQSSATSSRAAREESERSAVATTSRREEPAAAHSGATTATREEPAAAHSSATTAVREEPAAAHSSAITAIREEPAAVYSGATSATTSTAPEEEAAQAAGPVETGPRLIINYVWLRNDALGPLEKFNLYSWRALGHDVNIYALRFDRAPPTHEGLGIESMDANVINLWTQLGTDDQEAVRAAEPAQNPKAILGDARSLLRSWIGAVPPEGPSQDHIYNMVDLTKSYIGGTEPGIVLDMKVGPSEHLGHYVNSFYRYLISYTRGGSTAELPENQSIGTRNDELRAMYAAEFNKRVRELERADPKQKLFDQITGYHGQSYQATKQWLDVARKSPAGEALGEQDYRISEIGQPGHGPFRVFKRAGDQTNKSGGGTKEGEVRFLAEEVFRKQLQKSGGDPRFIKKAGAAMEALPKPKPLWDS